ncbi:MAG: hypothetical protein UV59_C0047G0004 [Candidatus Gottesmanbacteria bacterium GW2011_GWA1_43_11]|uniref:Uncharacterized protein n=1 Tax=Candidatus Gottesmanbacteria bacterium GW2011_GWA1_43_11 TaxID=1618436 RepID=A0A0G1CCC1_9BACT|nr:MAG: hypothetical protein UV59_C0047G0004 [Candidatus Gottesmanbacteria bacterium GW2011_GWA1_43_11]
MREGTKWLSKTPIDRLSLDKVTRSYNAALEMAEKTVRGCDLETVEGRFAAKQVIATACVLKTLIARPVLFLAPIYRETGGPENNPHRVIDRVGQDLFLQLQSERILSGGSLYIEENHRWVRFEGRKSEGSAVTVNIDTLDGTSGINVGKRDQASAIMITDVERNRFLAGSIVSLVDDALLTIEPGRIGFYQLREGYRKVDPQNVQRSRKDLSAIATLGRHMTKVIPGPPDLDTFGGYGLHRVFTGSLGTMFDAKGQIWYEAVMWGLMGEQLGLSVSDFQNRPYDWYQILRDSQQQDYRASFPLVISNNEFAHYQFLDQLEQWTNNPTNISDERLN